MKIISERKYHESVSYHQPFWYAGHIGTWGRYTFECDESGEVMPRKNPNAEENYQLCLTGEVRGETVVKGEIERRVNRWVEPSIGRCKCGEEVILDSFTNTCECGRDYNMSGQELAPREQWGEETGERWFDCY